MAALSESWSILTLRHTSKVRRRDTDSEAPEREGRGGEGRGGEGRWGGVGWVGREGEEGQEGGRGKGNAGCTVRVWSTEAPNIMRR